ncbi:MAG: hypothetical protein ABIG20_03910 [archaeon]
MVLKINSKSFMEFREKVARKEDQLFGNPKYFLIFCITTITLILVQYSLTLNALVPAVTLGMLWLIFWGRSTATGKSYLVIATAIGYLHEIIGVHYSWFSYATGDFGLGVPLWVALGYGCIYWSIENFWTHAEDKHYFPEKNFRLVWALSLLSLPLLDYFVFEMSAKILPYLVFIFLLFLLFNRAKEQHLAITVAFFCGLQEVLGTLLGAWSHPTLSLVTIIPTYTFFVWVILFAVHLLLKDITITRRELAIAVAIILLWVWTWFF